MSFVLILDLGFPGGSDGKGSACNMGDLGLIPGSRRFLGEGNGYPFQYSCLENSMGQRSPVGYNSPWCCKESDTTERLTLFHYYSSFMDFTGSSVVKNPLANAGNAGDRDSIPRSGRSPGGGNGNPLQYSCPENSMDRGAWWAIVHRVTKSRARQSTHPYLSYSIVLVSGIRQNDSVIHTLLSILFQILSQTPNLPLFSKPFGKYKFIFYVCECVL